MISKSSCCRHYLSLHHFRFVSFHLVHALLHSGTGIYSCPRIYPTDCVYREGSVTTPSVDNVAHTNSNSTDLNTTRNRARYTEDSRTYRSNQPPTQHWATFPPKCSQRVATTSNTRYLGCSIPPCCLCSEANEPRLTAGLVYHCL